MLTRAALTTSLLSVAVFAARLAADDDKAASPAPPTALEKCEIYPLRVGTQWIYQSGPLEVQEKVVSHETIEGEPCARIETIYDGRVTGFEHIAVRDDGLYRVAVGGRPVTPPLKFLSLPARPGVKWTVSSAIAGKTIRGEFITSEGTFQARSPRGDQDQSFKTHRVSGENFEVGGESISFTYDFVPQVGKVRQTAKAHGLETTIELREMVAPDQTPTRTASGGRLRFR